MKMEFKIVDVDELIPNPFQPREGFDKETINELADSFKSVGEMQPIIVRKHKKGYQIIAGERRWRAAKFAKLKEIPVLVKDTVEEDVLLESLIENLHRQNLEPHEEENAVYELWETGRKAGRWKNYAELGKALGKSEAWVIEHISVKRIRDESVHAHPKLATRTIHDVAGVEREDRETILAKVEKGEIKTPEVRGYARVTKKAPPKVKRAMFKPKARITPRVAERIIELPEKKQPIAVKQIESLRLEEEEAEELVKTLKIEIPRIPAGKMKEVLKNYDDLRRELKGSLETPEMKELGKPFRNLSAHYYVSGALNYITCPICGKGWENLVWKCHGLNIKEAIEKLKGMAKGGD